MFYRIHHFKNLEQTQWHMNMVIIQYHGITIRSHPLSWPYLIKYICQ